MEHKPKAIEKIKKETKEIERTVEDQLFNYIIAAFSLVAGLAWNEAIKSVLAAIFPAEYQGWLGKLLYALVISMIVIIVSIILSRIKKKRDKIL